MVSVGQECVYNLTERPGLKVSQEFAVSVSARATVVLTGGLIAAGFT